MMATFRWRFFLCLGLLLLRLVFISLQLSSKITSTSMSMQGTSSILEESLRTSRAPLMKVDPFPTEVLSQIPVTHLHHDQSVKATEKLSTNDAKDESFSACLLVMDENFRLYEWIAYHYHVLPLRYLVLAVDPRSKDSPEPVLNLFRQHLDITILSWNDTDYVSPDDPLPSDDEIERHRARQLRFVRKCLHHMHQNDRTWTALWDTDEYIGFNGYEKTRRMPDIKSSATSPSDMSGAGSVLHYLHEIREDRGFGMNRAVVGSKEIPFLMNETTHPLLDPRRFDTLRYRFRAKPGKEVNGSGKCMLNVQKIRNFPIKEGTVHRPVLSLCPSSKGDHLLRSPFVLHHYMGSWEAYSYRDDSRRGKGRTYANYLEKSQQGDEYENKLSQWMPEFVKSVGEERATVLLSNAGLDPNYNATFKVEYFQEA